MNILGKSLIFFTSREPNECCFSSFINDTQTATAAKGLSMHVALTKETFGSSPCNLQFHRFIKWLQCIMACSLECVTGFHGPKCEKPCRYPNYGLLCQKECNCTTEQYCNHITGCQGMNIIKKQCKWCLRTNNCVY